MGGPHRGIPALLALHVAPTAVLETQLSCSDISKISGGKIARDSYFPRRPRRFSRSERHSTHVASMSASRIAVCWAWSGLRRQPRSFVCCEGCCVCLQTRAAAQGSRRVSTADEFCVLFSRLSRFDLRFEYNSSLQIFGQFDLRFEYQCSPDAAGSPQLQKGERLLLFLSQSAGNPGKAR